MLTFNAIYSDSQEQLEDDSATTLTLIKRAINQGAKKFAAVMNREWWYTTKTFSLVSSQQFYQLPEDALRVSSLTVTVGSIVYTLTEVPDETTWQLLNQRPQTGSVPDYFYIRGNDEIGIWPTPSANITNGATLTYERRMRDMSQADYTTGTVTTSAGSAAVVGASTVFTATMPGRFLRVDDPSGDGMWYKISTVTDTTHINLENTITTAASAATYTIGELPDIPEEYHESLIDYACYRLYLRRRDRGQARDMKAVYEEALRDCMNNYSSKTTSQYSRATRLTNSSYIHQSQRYTITGS